MKNRKSLLVVFLFVIVTAVKAQSLEDLAKTKMVELSALMQKAKMQGIDVLKEETTIRTAEVFLKYANWDQQNVKANKDAFLLVKIYEKDAEEMANKLPDFEREDVIKMLDEATGYLKLLINKEVFRAPSPKIDWSKITVNNDELLYNNKPVFLADYTWKPNTAELNEYHGNQDGFFITPSYVVKEDGTINASKKQELSTKPTGNAGFIFFNHKTMPKWAKKKYGDNFIMRTNTYTAYDIDNPGAIDVQKKLIKGLVPTMAGKNYTALGYMLCNEPHFFTQKTGEKLAWASGPVSNFTIDKFKVWLKRKHKSIKALNSLWHTNFKNFNSVEIQIPIDTSLRGTPIWYDWSLFNMHRVTEWYTFLKEEILKYDAAAKVHLKIMPNLWTDNKRVHGIDLEALTDLSGIIGNDSGAENNHMWGPKEEWEHHYALNWRELCMGFDFMKSVSPSKLNFNSELHYLSTTKSRDLYQDPKYVRAAFWLAHTYGMTASQIWYWPREANGAISQKAINDKGYAGSNNQQPRVTNEVATTLIDLNTFSEHIMAMQRMQKPLRIFYSKTSAINKTKHMDDVFKLYESLHFNGVSLGFATQDILNKQKQKNWEAVLIYKTQFITSEEQKVLQNYLDNGGTIFTDAVSLKKDEYGNALPKLTQSKGVLVVCNSLQELNTKAMKHLATNNKLPEVTVTETNKLGVKTCAWKVIKNKEGNHILSVVNLGKTDATLKIKLKDAKKTVCKDLLKGIKVTANPTLKPYEVFYVTVLEDK
ncbi:beta-galactosidase [Cellulophaga omnivescoria]|uniref:beta-galactosidase n=1 Tax=Cellulophaga omnivescoria TaxID=1888890 RepID=UPI00098434F5|nr:beta-galactosidase [Cellulophaga omnivescoria]WBU88536.1 beta-galactosidase [Cellulophaga omnivescoria]